MSAANPAANGIESGLSAVGRGSQVMNIFNKTRGLLAFGRRAVHRRFLPGPSTRTTGQSSENSVFGVPRCTKVYAGVPRPTLAPRPSFLYFPAHTKTGVKTGQIMPKSALEQVRDVVGARFGLQFTNSALRTPHSADQSAPWTVREYHPTEKTPQFGQVLVKFGFPPAVPKSENGPISVSFGPLPSLNHAAGLIYE